MSIRDPSADIDSIATGAMMAAAGGFLDAFTYLAHGHVFANAMTGNVVLFATFLPSGDFAAARRHFAPIVAYVAGIIFARYLHLPPVAARLRSPHLACLMLEILFLFLIGFLPPSFPDLWITLGIAFVASVQLSTFSQIRGAAYASTFTSGNLRKFVEAAFAYFHDRRDPSVRIVTLAFASVCATFLAGATIGAVATIHLHNHAIWIVDGWLLLTSYRFVVIYRNHPNRMLGR